VTAGFLGVLMIIRPGLEGFQPAAALVLVTVLSIAFRDIITRSVPADLPSAAVACHGFLSVAAVGLGFLFVTGGAALPSVADAGRMAAAVGTGAAGYYAIVAAMRIGDTSALMPYRYSRLIFSLIIGMAFFAEHPDAPTLAGAGLILAAAFYTYLRERRVSRLQAAPAE
jgi:drug/metabolite transporter (DMT)-like permease